jgi:hypothetical protein
MRSTYVLIATLLVFGAASSALCAERPAFGPQMDFDQQVSGETEMPVPEGLMRHPFAPIVEICLLTYTTTRYPNTRRRFR